MKRRWGALAVWLVVASGVGGLSTVRADEGETQPSRVVEVSVVGGGPEASRLFDTVRELLARLGVTTTVAAPGRPKDASTLARVDVDLRNADTYRAVVTARGGRPTAQKSVPRRSSDAVTREELAHGIQAAVESLLISDSDPSGRPPPAASVPPPPPAPSASAPHEEPPPAPAASIVATETIAPPRRWSLEVEIAAGAYGYAKDATVVPRIGGDVALAYEGPWRPSLAARVVLAIPFGVPADLVTLRTDITSLRLLPALQVLRAGPFAVDAMAGGGLDIVSVDPESSTLPSSRIAAPFTRIDGVFTAGLGGRLLLTGGTLLSLVAGADFVLPSRTYAIQEGTTRTDVSTPWDVRPSLTLGFGFAALGPGRFSWGGSR